MTSHIASTRLPDAALWLELDQTIRNVLYRRLPVEVHADMCRDAAAAGSEAVLAALAPQVCTGLAATWCPVHGDCLCPPRPAGEGAPGERSLEDPMCPLHGDASTHAEVGAGDR